ncbi:MAG TPA: hypothetical protein PLX54_03515 [Candidatus Fermentibacter daniensis]|nr:hypothetical protein [Candidatus Fermentibacter daniensis]HOR07502.1 hypothetical protein [Candidatus Fermentibacter daniensis]HPK51424.1 hypothetical protein [Candidatus Fermentibacter daniensis]
MIPALFVWRAMLRRSAGSLASWIVLAAFPLLMGIHHAGTVGFIRAAAAALPAASAAFACLGWRSSQEREGLARILDWTCFGRTGMTVSSILLGVLLGSLTGYACLSTAGSVGGGPIPWQSWAMPALVSIQVSCVSDSLGRRSAGPPAAVLALLAGLSVMPDPGTFGALLASPGHLARLLGAGGVSIHPDSYLAASVILSAAAVYASVHFRDRIERNG